MYFTTVLRWLCLICAVCGQVSARDFKRHELDFGSRFENDNSGIISLASDPFAAAILKVDKSNYPELFDTIVSSSIDSLFKDPAPRESIFDARNFGFYPIASKSFINHKAARLTELGPQQQRDSNSDDNIRPLRYNIETVHDANYRVYNDEEDGQKILSELKNDPSVAAYFQPLVNAEVNHPIDYRKEELIENLNGDSNYNPYIAGPARIRRYTRGRRRENLKKSNNEDDDDPYNYKADYISLPKAFSGSSYSSPYTEKKDNDDYTYPYKYGSGYDHKEYDRIKDLSEKQAAEIRENPGNCKEVKRDGMTCMTCKDPKTGGNYESCSYVAEPKNNKYAYSKERKFDSNDEPEGTSGSNEKSADKPEKSEKYREAQQETAPQKFTSSDEEKPSSSYKKHDDDNSGEKYKAYYVHTSKPTPSEALRAASDESSSAESKESKPYDYKKSLPNFYTDNEPKKDVEHVLAEFKKKDRSSCNKVQKNGMTCFQCLDKNGLKHEECMFVSESAPKQSHLAYQEVKEFTSKPATLDGGNVEAESQTITTSTPPIQKSAAYVAAPSAANGKKQKRKKASQAAASANPEVQTAVEAEKTIDTPKVKRSNDSENKNAEIIDEAANIAPPEEFAGASSKGAFWAETMPRYSADLGVTLPEYMLSRSEHETSFDEAVAGV